MDRRFFHRLGASRLDRTICSSAGGGGHDRRRSGIRYGTEPEQFRHSKLIIAWGANILGTNVHLWPFIVEARRNGAKLYTIDPRRNRTGAARRPALLHQSGQRYRAGAGDDARDHRREACTTPITSSATPPASTICASACATGRRSAPPNSPGIAGRGDRRAGARVRHHAARGDPPELRRAAQRARRAWRCAPSRCCRR